MSSTGSSSSHSPSKARKRTNKQLKSALKKPTNSSIPTESDKPSSRTFSLWNIWVASTLLKTLLFPTYHSTDLEVHRNWLAITSTLPISKWYIENTSIWTLDYPPLFAYFEWLLTWFIPGDVVQDGILQIVKEGQGTYGLKTIVFLRITVIISEILLFVVMQWFVNIQAGVRRKTFAFIVASSVVLSPGLLIVDHIHFQYNGMLFGLMMLMIVFVQLDQSYWLALTFSVLLCFKHINLYLAPAVFVYLLRRECLDWESLKTGRVSRAVRWVNLFKLGAIVVVVFGLSFAPFIYHGVIPNVISRLFPFSRGLTHAYWAPNVWAIYSFNDKVLTSVLKVSHINKLASKFLIYIPSVENIVERLANGANNGTKGLVQDVQFTILPDITPRVCFLLTLFYDILSVVPLIVQPNFKRFVGALTLNAYASFLFGWHVHEKAIMLIIFPFTFLVNERRILKCFMVLVGAGYVSLFPLLPGQNLLKWLYTFIWFIIYFVSFMEVSKTHADSFSVRVFLFDRVALIYLIGLIPMVLMVFFMDVFKEKFEVLQKFEFVGLMIYSVYCATGVISSWVGLSWLYFFDDSIWEEEK
ncbi:hypothetical protein WICPIJ_007079 [Wickerhamomyces pijperi]|uniref:Alpha-1,3-glucosyltransferase n=1 Tax=Wickerhamomyces pijperi TaxID=599730 RepID=A0A9P8Q2H4_WICPI|nr:hypothetical protein WICPIJ_007079 [Wickerhamomyces pijperi]